MDDADIALRNLTYRMFVEAGGRLTAEDVAARAGIALEQVGEAWQRLSEAHAIVLQDSGDDLRMLNPFSAVPTPYQVHANGGRWYANCAWDAFGVLAALHVDGRIETTCSDCGEPIDIEVRDQSPDNETLVFHCLIPAAQWWDDIVFT